LSSVLEMVTVMCDHVTRRIVPSFPVIPITLECLLNCRISEVPDHFVSNGLVYILFLIFHAKERDRCTIP
jgi:hypothetical protein